jgi:hypothetical protein
MTALGTVELCFQRKKCRAPMLIPILNIVTPAPGISRHIIIPVPGNTPQFCVPVETVTATGIRYQAEKTLVSQIINPGQRGCGSFNDILPCIVIKVTVLHGSTFLNLIY